LIELKEDSLRGQVLADGRPVPIRFEAPLPPQTVRRGMPLERESIGDLIGDLLVRDDLMQSFVMAALPPAAVEWRVLEWPRGQVIPDDPLEAVRSLDADRLRLPFPLHDAVIDLCPLPGLSATALLAATSNRMVDAWIQVFDYAGVQLDRLAPFQACEYLGLRSQIVDARHDDLLVLLSPDGPNLRLLMVADGIPRFDRSIPLIGEARLEEVLRSVTFYRRTDAEVRRIRLFQASPVEDAEALARRLGVPLETLKPEFDSLVLAGLAIPEVAA